MTWMLTIAGLLFLTLSGAQAEATRPSLKPAVTVTHEVVLIGDLVEHAGTKGDVAIFRSPDLGTTGSVATDRVREALRPYGLANLDTGGVTEVVVTRPSRALTVNEMKNRIVAALAGQRGLGAAEDLELNLDQTLRTVHVEAHATGELVVRQLSIDRYGSRFSIMLDLPGSAILHRTPLRLSGRVIETTETAVLIRSMQRGEIIRSSDIAIERRPQVEISKDGIGRAEYAVGLAAKRPLRAGHVLRHPDLMKPQLVQRDDAVTLVYEIPGVLLTVRGKAVETGAEGDVVSVLNLQSKRTVQGTVIGPGQVAVIGTIARAAAIRTASLTSTSAARQPK